MIKINYKDDIPPIAVTLTAGGQSTELPDSDFTLRFWADNPKRYAEVGRKNGEWVGCTPLSDGRLMCYIVNKGLGVGRLICDYTVKIEDPNYMGETRRLTVRTPLDIELVPGNCEGLVKIIDSYVMSVIVSDVTDLDSVLAKCKAATLDAETIAEELREYHFTDYYTKAETEMLLLGKEDNIELLTSSEINAIVDSAWS